MSSLTNFLICLAGLPASGKTTFAKILMKTFSETYNNPEVVIVDPDLIRNSLTGNEFDPEKEKLVREKNILKITSTLEEGKIVISDDLNYYTSMRHDLKTIADDLNLHFFIIHVTTPLKTCLEWNEKRGRKIPDEIIERTRDKFDYFDKYHWDHPIYEFDPSQGIELTKHASDVISYVISVLKLPRITNQEKNHQDIVSNFQNERLETITRKTVGKLLQNPENLSFKKKILDLRKKFTKLNSNSALSESEISNKLMLFLEKALNKKLR